MSAEKPVRIGFVGVGGMGQCAHLRNYLTIPGCEVVAIAEIRERTAAMVAQRYGIQKVYKDHGEMLANEDLDGIVASQPFNRHGVLLPELMKAGKPIFIEKPLASTLEAGEGIVRALAEAESWVMVGYHKRSDPASMYARNLMNEWQASGTYGGLKYVRLLMPAGDWVANGFLEMVDAGDRGDTGPLAVEPPPTDMSAEAYQQYNAFVNYYIHQVNLLRFFLGEPYRVTYADPAGVLLVAVSESGVTGTIEMSPYTNTIDWQESAFVCFEHATIDVGLVAPLASNRPGSVEVMTDPGGGATPMVCRPHLPWIHAMRQQAMNFVAAIRGEARPPCEAPEALQDLQVAREYLRLWKGC
jgi:predicted dehydrogenase